MSSLRTLQTGQTYQLPPITQGIPPTACTTQQVRCQLVNMR